MARGNGGQRLFHGDDGHQRMLERLKNTVLDARIKRLLKRPRNLDEVPQWRCLEQIAEDLVQAVAEFCGTSAEAPEHGAGTWQRIWCISVPPPHCGKLPPFSLIGHPDSASDLIRMAESVLTQSPELRLERENIERLLTNAH